MQYKKIAVASGKGGTGKTTIAVNLYNTMIKHLKKNVLLVDCDVEEPNAGLFFKNKKITDTQNIDLLIPEIDEKKCTFCRKCVEYCEFNAITVIHPVKYAKISEDLCHSCGACSYACKFQAITEHKQAIGTVTSFSVNEQLFVEGKLKIGSSLQTPVIGQLKEKTQNLAPTTIYDAPPGTSCSVVATISDVDYIILVTEPTPFGLNDLKLIIELTRQLNKPIGIVINKVGIGNDDLYTYVEQEKIPILTQIPFDKKIAEHYSNSELLSETVKGYETYFLEIIKKISQ